LPCRCPSPITSDRLRTPILSMLPSSRLETSSESPKSAALVASVVSRLCGREIREFGLTRSHKRVHPGGYHPRRWDGRQSRRCRALQERRPTLLPGRLSVPSRRLSCPLAAGALFEQHVGSPLPPQQSIESIRMPRDREYSLFERKYAEVRECSQHCICLLGVLGTRRVRDEEFSHACKSMYLCLTFADTAAGLAA
jgi:hypothetical protein